MADLNTAFGLKSQYIDPSFKISQLMKNDGLTMEEARKAAAKSYLEQLEQLYGKGYHFRVKISPNGDSLLAMQGRKVVETIKDEKREITLQEMHKFQPDIELGEIVYQKLPIIPFDDFPQAEGGIKIANTQITEI